MNRISIIKAFTVLVAVLGLQVACGLKGPPVPPDMSEPKTPAAPPGSGSLPFGPGTTEEDREAEKILKLYGGQNEKSGSELPRVEEAIGADALMGDPDDSGADTPVEQANPFDPAIQDEEEESDPDESDDKTE